MKESSKIAKLWAQFHRLPREHRELILKAAELMGQPTTDRCTPAKRKQKSFK